MAEEAKHGHALSAAMRLLLALCVALGPLCALVGCSEEDASSTSSNQATAAKAESDQSSDSADSAQKAQDQEAPSSADKTPDAIPGASSALEKEAAQSVRDSLAAVAEKDAATLKGYLCAVGFDPNDYGVTWTCFAQTYYQDFSFSVDRVEEGTNAQGGVGVSFTVTVPVMTKVVDLLYETNKASVEAGANASESGHANKAWKKAWASAKVETNTLGGTLYVLQAADGTWEFQDKALFAALLMDGYDPRQV